MKRIGLWAAAACLSLTVASAAPQFGAIAAEADDPVSIVREIYLQYDEDGELFDVAEKHFSPGLLQLWRDVEAGGDGDVADALGFAVFNVSGDDETIDIEHVRLTLIAEKYVVASYVVLLEQGNAIYATKKYFQYNFEETGDGWKIVNIDWGRERQTLRQYLTEIKALRALR